MCTCGRDKLSEKNQTTIGKRLDRPAIDRNLKNLCRVLLRSFSKDLETTKLRNAGLERLRKCT